MLHTALQQPQNSRRNQCTIVPLGQACASAVLSVAALGSGLTCESHPYIAVYGVFCQPNIYILCIIAVFKQSVLAGD